MGPKTRSSDETSKQAQQGSDQSSSDEMRISLFLCKKCPGVEIPADERDEHRRFHIEQDRKMKEEKRQTRAAKRAHEEEEQRITGRPGPKSKTRRQ